MESNSALARWTRWLLKGPKSYLHFLNLKGYLRGNLHLARIFFAKGVWGGALALQQGGQVSILNAKKSKSIRFIIYAPDYESNSAGIHCLYKLCHDLNELGWSAAICDSARAPARLNTPVVSWGTARRLVKSENCWVVYPEIIHGNPLGAKGVIRWVLNRPGHLGGQKKYAPNEKVFVYSDQYRAYVDNEIIGKLFMFNMDRSLFYPPADMDAPRPLKVFYVGKSTFKPGFVDPQEAFEITRATPARSELGKLFRASSVLYCFDNTTALTYEAIACGCPVMIIPDGTQTWADYERLELGTDGIYWDREPDVPRADHRGLASRVANFEAAYAEQLKHLIAQTVERTTS